MAVKPESSASWSAFVAELETKIGKLGVKATELREAKRSVALGAARGDAKARAELDRLNAELSAAEIGAEDAQIALEEAQEALAAAEQREHRSAEVDRLRKVRELAKQRNALAADVDKTIAALVAEIAKIQANAAELQELLDDTPQHRELHAIRGWPTGVVERLLAEAEAAGIRLDHMGARPVNTTLCIGPASWSDAELERLANQQPLRIVDDAPEAA